MIGGLTKCLKVFDVAQDPVTSDGGKVEVKRL